MKISFSVEGLPPRKDAANSMWRKVNEMGRVKALRMAAWQAMGDRLPTQQTILLGVVLWALPTDGDLSDFVGGICDSLAPVSPQVPIDPGAWRSLPPNVHPSQGIIYRDDSCIRRIHAERRPPDNEQPRYEIEVEWDE
jgi:hypothetical protein